MKTETSLYVDAQAKASMVFHAAVEAARRERNRADLTR